MRWQESWRTAQGSQSCDVQNLQYTESNRCSRELSRVLTDHVEATCVTVELHVLRGNLHVVVGVDTVGSSKETEQKGVGVKLLDHVEKTHDDVVTTSSLATGQNTSNL